MPRPKTPDGRRVPVSFKLTEAEAGLVDSLRGETERSVWLREAAMSVARGNSGIPERASGRRRATGAIARLSQLAPMEFAPAEPEPGESAAKPANCKHKGLRMSKGVCPDCLTYVESKPKR